MLDDAMKAQLTQYLTHLRRPIRITAALDDGPDSTALRELLRDVAAASSMVEVVDDDGTPDDGAGIRRPSFAIHLPGEAARVRFAGVPLGHELTSLVLALLHVGGHPPKVGAEVLAQVDGLGGTYHFETYFSQSCQNCPDVVQALNLMAVRNPNVTHVAIDGATFQAEVDDASGDGAGEIIVDDHGRTNVPGVFAAGDVTTVHDESAVASQPVCDVACAPRIDCVWALGENSRRRNAERNHGTRHTASGACRGDGLRRDGRWRIQGDRLADLAVDPAVDGVHGARSLVRGDPGAGLRDRLRCDERRSDR